MFQGLEKVFQQDLMDEFRRKQHALGSGAGVPPAPLLRACSFRLNPSIPINIPWAREGFAAARSKGDALRFNLAARRAQ